MRFVLLAVFAARVFAQSAPEQRKLDLDSFEKVWTTIRDKHWEKNPAGLDWQKIHDEYAPKAEAARTTDETRAVIRDMLGRLHQTHFQIFPAGVYRAVGNDEPEGPGSTGIDIRVLDGHAIVVSVDPGSPAEKAGVKPGWELLTARGQNLDQTLRDAAGVSELTRTRAVLSRLSGPMGGRVAASFLDGSGKTVKLDLGVAAPRGVSTAFGNLPSNYVWIDSKKLGSSGYIRFNFFLDLVRVMGSFGDLVKSCASCDGLIIDLRGNPGGIGGMAMGMAGYIVDKPDQRLGTMFLRDATLNFVLNPRAEQFLGPVAILVDGCSASTSEILAGGLKDLGRARIFGTRTAAAALPSVIERLPNGDGFQYAIANYVSEGGKPLEGTGVEPDQKIELTRAALLEGRDPVIEAAQAWIQSRKGAK
jgi:carboxyl-terminal processing protease